MRRKLVHLALLLSLIFYASNLVYADTPQAPSLQTESVSPLVMSALMLPDGVRYNLSFVKPDGVILSGFTSRITLPVGAQLIDIQETDSATFVNVAAPRVGQGQTLKWTAPTPSDEQQILTFSFRLKDVSPGAFSASLTWGGDTPGNISFVGEAPVADARENEGRLVLNSHDSGLSLLPVANTGVAIGVAEGVVPDGTTLTVRKLPLDFNPPPELGDFWWCSIVEIDDMPQGAQVAVQVPLRKPLPPSTLVELFALQPDGTWLPLGQPGIVSADGQFVAYLHPGGVVATGTDPALESAPPAEVIVAPPEEAPPAPADQAPPVEEAVQPPADQAPPVEEAQPVPVDQAPPVEEVVQPPADQAPPIEEAVQPPVEQAPPVEEAQPAPADQAPPIEEAVQPPADVTDQTVTNADGSTTSATFNAEGSLIDQTTENPDGSTTTQVLDQFGNVTQTTTSLDNPDGSHTNFTENADGTEVKENFDNAGNFTDVTTTVTNEDGTQTSQTVSPDGVLLAQSTTNADGSVTSQVFDAQGNVTQTTTTVPNKDGGRTDTTVNSDGSQQIANLDEQGNLVNSVSVITTINEDGTHTVERITLDPQGNEISRTTYLYNEDGTPFTAADLGGQSDPAADDFVVFSSTTDDTTNGGQTRGGNSRAQLDVQPLESVQDIADVVSPEVLDKDEDVPDDTPPETTIDANANLVTTDTFANEKGEQTTTTTTTDTTGNVISETVEVRDANGNLQQVVTVINNPDGSQSVLRSAFDASGTPIQEKTTINADGSQTIETSFLNEKGEQVGTHTTIINPDGSSNTQINELQPPTDLFDTIKQVQGTVTVAPDGTRTEQITRTSVNSADNTLLETTTFTRIENPDGSQIVNSTTTDAGGNAIKTEQTTVNPDGSSSSQSSEINDDGTVTDTTSAINTDGSASSQAVTRNSFGVIVGLTNVTRAADGSQTTQEHFIGNDGLISESSEILNPDGSAEQEFVKRDFLGNEISRSEFTRNADGTSFGSTTDPNGNVRQVFNATEEVNIGANGQVQSVSSNVTQRNPDGTRSLVHEAFIDNGDGTFTLLRGGSSVVIDPLEAGEQGFVTAGGTKITIDEKGISFVAPGGAENTPTHEPQVSESTDGQGNHVQTTIATDKDGNQNFSRVTTDGNGEPLEQSDIIKDADGQVTETTTSTTNTDGSVRFIHQVFDEQGNVIEESNSTTQPDGSQSVTTNIKGRNGTFISVTSEVNPEGSQTDQSTITDADGNIISRTDSNFTSNGDGTNTRNTTIRDGTSNTILFEETVTFEGNPVGAIEDGTSNTIIIGETGNTGNGRPPRNNITDGTSNTVIIGEVSTIGNGRPPRNSFNDGTSNTIIFGEVGNTGNGRPSRDNINDGTSNTVIIGEVSNFGSRNSGQNSIIDGTSNTLFFGEETDPGNVQQLDRTETVGDTQIETHVTVGDDGSQTVESIITFPNGTQDHVTETTTKDENGAEVIVRQRDYGLGGHSQETQINNPDGSTTIDNLLTDERGFAVQTNTVRNPDGSVTQNQTITDANGNVIQTQVFSADLNGGSHTDTNFSAFDLNGVPLASLILTENKLPDGTSTVSGSLTNPDGSETLINFEADGSLTVIFPDGLQKKVIPDTKGSFGFVNPDGSQILVDPESGLQVIAEEVGQQIQNILEQHSIVVAPDAPSDDNSVQPIDTDTLAQPVEPQGTSGVTLPDPLPALQGVADLVKDIDLNLAPQTSADPPLDSPVETVVVIIDGQPTIIPVQRVCSEQDGVLICTLRTTVGQCLVSTSQFINGEVRGTILCASQKKN